MRIKTVHALLTLSLAAALAGCSSGGAPARAAATTAASGKTVVASARPAATSPGASPTARGSAAPVSGAALLSELVPYPGGTTPWTEAKTGVLGIDDFVDDFYAADGRATSRAVTLKRGFTTSARRGWFNADGTQSDIWLVEFTSAQGARSMYLSLTSKWKEAKKPTTTFTDAAVHGTGELVPALDTLGNSSTKVAAAAGRIFVYVRVYSPGTLEKPAAIALAKQQYARLG